VAALQRAALINARLTLAENRVVIEALELSGAKTTVALDKNKKLNWTEILQKASGAPAVAPAGEGPASASAMDVRLARLSLDGVEVGVADQSPAAPVRLDVVQGFVTLKDVSLDLSQAVPLEAGFALRQGGRFNASGSVIPDKGFGRAGPQADGAVAETVRSLRQSVCPAQAAFGRGLDAWQAGVRAGEVGNETSFRRRLRGGRPGHHRRGDRRGLSRLEETVVRQPGRPVSTPIACA
jgi:hypothetical protein